MSGIEGGGGELTKIKLAGQSFSTVYLVVTNHYLRSSGYICFRFNRPGVARVVLGIVL